MSRDDLADLSGADVAAGEASLDALARQGRIDRDAEGRVIGSAGLTIGDGPHGLSFGGTSFRTWCAYDAIGIPAALAVDAVVETACAVCQTPIRMDAISGEPSREDAAQLWMSAGGADMRADFCAPTVLLCSDEHAQTWAQSHDWAGEVQSPAEAAAAGRKAWADPAFAYKDLRERAAGIASGPNLKMS